MMVDAELVPDDQLAAVARASRDGFDYALLLDGLAAEREQGITIDVAYRYFSTGRRSFIIADSPGHEQFTRNMATGASVSDVAVLLVDARKGLLPQTRRHATIASLMGIRDVVLAVNKMDLVAYSESVFRAIAAGFDAHAERLSLRVPLFRCPPASARMWCMRPPLCRGSTARRSSIDWKASPRRRGGPPSSAFPSSACAGSMRSSGAIRARSPADAFGAAIRSSRCPADRRAGSSAS
jgi:hypothetical protein